MLSSCPARWRAAARAYSTHRPQEGASSGRSATPHALPLLLVVVVVVVVARVVVIAAAGDDDTIAHDARCPTDSAPCGDWLTHVGTRT